MFDAETKKKVLDTYIYFEETIGEGATCKVKHVVAKVEDELTPDKIIDQHLALKIYSKSQMHRTQMFRPVPYPPVSEQGYTDVEREQDSRPLRKD